MLYVSTLCEEYNYVLQRCSNKQRKIKNLKITSESSIFNSFSKQEESKPKLREKLVSPQNICKSKLVISPWLKPNIHSLIPWQEVVSLPQTMVQSHSFIIILLKQYGNCHAVKNFWVLLTRFVHVCCVWAVSGCCWAAVIPPPHRRHLARSLPVPRGRIATGGCLTTLAFSVEMKN